MDDLQSLAQALNVHFHGPVEVKDRGAALSLLREEGETALLIRCLRVWGEWNSSRMWVSLERYQVTGT